jgi:hypothetical protein
MASGTQSEGWIAMVTVMDGIEKYADYYRGYSADERSLGSVAIVLVTIVAMWLLFYVISVVGPQPAPEMVGPMSHGVYAAVPPALR